MIDGDSLVLSDGREIRLIGVDTPEFSSEERNRTNAQRFGVEYEGYRGWAAHAKEFVERVTHRGGKPLPVRLELDPANVASLHRDAYGRTLAYVWVCKDFPKPPADCDYLPLNAQIVKNGEGSAYTRFPFALRKEFYQFQKEAKAAKKGFWQFRKKK